MEKGNQVKVQPAIRMLNFVVSSVDFSYNFTLDDAFYEKIVIDFNYQLQFLNDHDHNYVVKFEADLSNEEYQFIFKVDAIAIFESLNPITQSFKKSTFVNQNSPAIAFPFLRSFVNTFTTNCGLNPIILPSYNFSGG